MPNKNYRNGASKERRIVQKARNEGKLAFRSAGSHSPIDIFILDPKTKNIFLIQSKLKKMGEVATKNLLDTIKQYDGIYHVRTSIIRKGET
jgi:Holliday junction resolvase